MMKIIRLTILAVIALAFAFNSFGFIFYFLIEREYAKEEAFEKIAEMKNHERIEVLTVSSSDISNGNIIQRINKKEIRYEGKMYDIVKEEKHFDKIIFYCVHDEKEDKLEKEYSKNIQKNLNRKTATNAQLYFNLQIQFAEIGKKPVIFYPVHKTAYSIFKINNYHLNDNKVLTPPPKLIFS